MTQKQKGFIVHAYELRGFVRVDRQIRDLIRKGLKKKYGALYKAEEFLKFSESQHRTLDKRFVSTRVLFRLAKYAKISFLKVKKHISKWSDSPYQKHVYDVKFPIKMTPLHIRIASHVIGDGSASRHGKYIQYTWTQKRVKPMKISQQILLGKSFQTKLKEGGQAIEIPKFVMKIVCACLELDVDKFDAVPFLKSCLILPKKFRLQVLTALIEDEGTIERTRIVIRMKDREIVKTISEIIDSLDYGRTEVVSYIEKSKWSGQKFRMSKISILASGTRDYKMDIEDLEKEDGKIYGLWAKSKKLKMIST